MRMQEFGSLKTSNHSMQHVFNSLNKIKETNSYFFLSGELGCGKKTISKEFHKLSRAKDYPLIIFNADAYPGSSIENPFKDLVKGIIELQGTFVLENVDHLPKHLQIQLGSAIQKSKQNPNSTRNIVGLSQQPIDDLVKEGTIIPDLVFSLGIFRLNLPTLKKRKEDIENISNFLIQEISKDSQKKLSPGALDTFLQYSWPGNISELRNTIESALIRSNESLIRRTDLPGIFQEQKQKKSQGTRLEGTLKETIESVEKELIHEALENHGWNKSKVAKVLGISRAGLIMKVEKYKLEQKPSAA